MKQSHAAPEKELLQRIQHLERELAGEKRRRVDEEKRYSDNFAFISRTAQVFFEFPLEENVFDLIGTKLLEITGALYISVHSIVMETGLVKVESVSCDPGKMRQLYEMLGANLLGSHFTLPPHALAHLKTGELCHVEGGVHELACRAIPQAICSIIEKVFAVGDIYAIGFAMEGEIFGSASIVGLRGREVRNLDIIKIFLRQAAIALQRRKVEAALRESEANYRHVVEQANDHILVLQEGLIKYANPACFDLLIGYMPEDYNEKPFISFIHPDDRERVMNYHRKRIEGDQSPHVYPLRILCKDGSVRWYENNSSPVLWKGKRATLSLLTDVTEQKMAEEKIRAQLKEKEVLLKEIHHRVKNNLQIVSSLLKLQASGITEPCVQSLLRESQNRVRSMALVHEKLYQSPDFAHIPFNEYVGSMAVHLLHTFCSEGISIRSDMEEVCLDVELAIPCGLIVNELISNALKHAFLGRKEGQISLRMWKSCENGKMRVTLEIGDDGVGFPVPLDLNALSSLGLQLVHDLAEQLAGSVSISVDRGTLFTITFPVE